MENDRPHRKQVRHYDGLGDARELTFSCYHRLPYLTKPYVIQWFLDALLRIKERHPIHLWAYVVMPEHVHALVWPTDPACKISNVLKTLKPSVAKRARNHLLQSDPSCLETGFHFWQPGPGYDRNLYEPKAIWDSIDYFHMNPVRRKLCERPEDWPWSSAREHAGLEVEFPLIDRISIPGDPR